MPFFICYSLLKRRK